MDELREKIAKVIYRQLYPYSNFESSQSGQQKFFLEIVGQILALIKEAGYRKIEGKPPVLSDEEMLPAFKVRSERGTAKAFEYVSQVQRDADVRFYEQQ